jgi:hypothetical protein
MSSLMRQLRRDKKSPKKTQIGVYGAINPMSLLVDGDILLVFDDEGDLKTYVSSHKQLSPPLQIKPMYFQELMQGFALGGRYGLRRGVAKKFHAAWTSQFKEKPPFSVSDIESDVDFLTLSVKG